MAIRKKKFSVFNRMFLVYSITMVAIYIILVVLFLNNINHSSDELIRSTRTKSQNYLRSIEQQLDNIYLQQVNLASDSNVAGLAYSIYDDKYEKNLLIMELLGTMEGIESMNPLIDDIVISFPHHDMTLSTLNGYSTKRNEVWENVETGSEYNYLITSDEKVILNFTYPLIYSENEDYVPDYNVQIFLSNELLSDSLKIFSDERGDGASLLFSLEQDLLIENGDEGIVGRYLDSLVNISFDASIQSFDGYELVTIGSDKYSLAVISYINGQAVDEIKAKYISILTLVMLFISILFAASLIYTKKVVVKPINEMIDAFGKIQDGDFDVRIYHEADDEFNFLYNGFNESVENIQNLINDIYEQENLIQKAELIQLQSQINPHFLYNSFFIINRMAKNESYDLISKFVSSLAKYYRFINKETSHFISLKSEVEHMQNYIDIQQTRFSDKISVDIEELPKEIESILVPKLLLQPIVENAYNYGLANKLADGLIRIRYHKEGKYVRVVVEDNGDDADLELVRWMRKRLYGKDEEDGNHALSNINRRLALTYGEHCNLSIDLSEIGGIKIELKLNSQYDLLNG